MVSAPVDASRLPHCGERCGDCTKECDDQGKGGSFWSFDSCGSLVNSHVDSLILKCCQRMQDEKMWKQPGRGQLPWRLALKTSHLDEFRVLSASKNSRSLATSLWCRWGRAIRRWNWWSSASSASSSSRGDGFCRCTCRCPSMSFGFFPRFCRLLSSLVQ